MKKIYTILICICLAFALSGCNKSATTSIFGASYFLANSSNHGIGTIDETNVYSISYAQSENAKTLVINVDSNASSYTTHLTNVIFNETPCYLLETTQIIKGSISYNEETTPIDDIITTKCYFLGVNKNLKPLYSERLVKSKSIFRTAVERDGTEVFAIYDYEYKLTTTYTNYNSVSTIEINKKPEEDQVFEATDSLIFDNLNQSSTYIDNELMLFAPRAMGLSSYVNKSFSTLDVVSKTVHSMKLSSHSTESTKQIELSSYFRNNEKIASAISTFGVVFEINAETKGSGITCYYADFNNSQNRACLIKATTTASYNLGTYTYEIKSTSFTD